MNRKAGPNGFLSIFYYRLPLLFENSSRVETDLTVTLDWPRSCGCEVFKRDISDKDYYEIGTWARTEI